VLRCSVLRSKASRAGYRILVTYSWYGTRTDIITNAHCTPPHYRTPTILYPQQSTHEPPALTLAVTSASVISYSSRVENSECSHHGAGPYLQNTITIRYNITITRRLDLPYTNTAGHHHHHQNPLCQTSPPHSEPVVAKRENSITSLQVRTKRTPHHPSGKSRKIENRKSPSTTLSTEHHDPPPTAAQPADQPPWFP